MPDDEEFVPVAVPSATAQLLTEQFYAWERRGRGWEVWGCPVGLEPPFRPFIAHEVPTVRVRDDGRRHTLFSALAGFVREAFTPERKAVPPPDEEQSLPDVLLLEEDTLDTELVELGISLAPDQPVRRDTAEQLLLGLTSTAFPVSFELIGSADAIVVQLCCRAPDSAHVTQQLRAYFPDAVIEEQPGYLRQRWERAAIGETVIVDFGLAHEFMRPLLTPKNFDVDALIAVTGALSEVREGECALFQVLTHGARHPWAESILRAVSDQQGKSFFVDAPDMPALAKEKVSRPLCAAAIRVGARSASPGRSWKLARSVGDALLQLANPVTNELIALSNDDYPLEDHEQDLLRRQSRRSGMILNTAELVALVHLPSELVRAEKLRRETRKSKAAPPSVQGSRLVLGENAHHRRTVQVTLNPEQRMRHAYVIGASGTGKSTLLLNLIVQDIRNGEGLGVLDPHGDLIDLILGHIPEERFEDVVLFDPSDAAHPVGFNILSAHSELEKNLLASDLAGIFRRFSTSWGDQMNSVLSNSILAFLESSEGGTLIDLRRFLVEPDFRREFLKTVQDPEVVYYFEREFALLAGKPQGPILTRLNTFLRPKPIRHMVAQKENRLDFAHIMNEGKIFLAKLAQGAIGEENAYLLGAFLVAKFHQLTMGRQELAAEERRNFVLYLDEFHNFVTPSISSLLSGARKYRLGLVLALGGHPKPANDGHLKTGQRR